jgi:hypothetical protein
MNIIIHLQPAGPRFLCADGSISARQSDALKMAAEDQLRAEAAYWCPAGCRWMMAQPYRGKGQHTPGLFLKILKHQSPMSCKSHFMFEDGIEGYEDTSEPQTIFGKFTGWNAYLIIETRLLKSVKIKDDLLYVEIKNTKLLPPKFKIWGDAVIEAEIDEDGLLIALKGGHHITKEIVRREFQITP